MIERAQWVAREEHAPPYTYEKRWVLERWEGTEEEPKRKRRSIM